MAGALVQRLKARLGALRVGEALDRTTDVGGLVDEVWRAALQAHVDEAEAEGAEVRAGKLGGGHLCDLGLPLREHLCSAPVCAPGHLCTAGSSCGVSSVDEGRGEGV